MMPKKAWQPLEAGDKYGDTKLWCFQTDGQLSTTTLLSHSPSSNRWGENTMKVHELRLGQRSVRGYHHEQNM